MRLIDADDLAAKIMMEAPDFMDGGSSITKAFILAMVKTRSVTPTIDAVQVVRCKDCCYWLPMNRFHEDYHPGNGECELNCWVRPMDWYCADGEKVVRQE